MKTVLKFANIWGILFALISFGGIIRMVNITKDTIIGDILDIAPQTAPIFLSIGMHCLGCPSSRGETVEEACAVHGVDCEDVYKRQAIAFRQICSRASGISGFSSRGGRGTALKCWMAMDTGLSPSKGSRLVSIS